MTFSEVYDYLKNNGCEFEFDNPSLFKFSTVHVLWKGEEIGTLDSYNMTFNVNGWFTGNRGITFTLKKE